MSNVLQTMNVTAKRRDWELFAVNSRAQVKVADEEGRAYNGIRLELSYQEFTIVFQENAKGHFRASCELSPQRDYYFIIRPKDFRAKIRARFSRQRFRVGNPHFEGHFEVQSSDLDTTAKWLRDTALPRLLSKKKDLSCGIRQRDDEWVLYLATYYEVFYSAVNAGDPTSG